MQQDQTFSTKFKVFFTSIIGLKLLLLCLFSSGYQDNLFIPFVLDYLTYGGNPWEHTVNPDVAFPYPPLMLYILSAFMWPVQHLEPDSTWINLFYGFPLLLSDLAVAAILLRLFIWNKTEIFIFYFASPIILFATYMHGQLDIIPTAILFSSLFLLARRFYFYAAIFAGLAISTKFHTVAALPLMIIYLLSKGKYKEMGMMIIIPFIIYFGFSYPYLNNGNGFNEAVIHNHKQNLIFDSFIAIGEVKVYLPILLSAIIYLRFSAYRKVNIDLLYAATGALFSIFLLFIEPSPGWFIWLTPFFTIFFIRYFDGIQHYLLHISLVSLYLIYYVFFHHYDFDKIIFNGEAILNWTLNFSFPLGNIIYTSLQAVLLATIYLFYKNGIKSNATYTMEQAFVIGIGGDSGAGKTTLIGHLDAIFGEHLLQLEGDSDHKWERGHDNWGEYTHLNPKANLLHRQAEQLGLLKNRKTIKRSDYNHDTGKFTDADKIKPKDFIVLAGLHPFYLPKMRKVIDLKIFLDLDERLRKSWKIERDKKYRNYTQEQVLESLNKRADDSKRYIHPQKKFSDLIIKLFPISEELFEGYSYKGELGLIIEMNANIPLDNVIKSFEQFQCDICWDYSKDLTTQYIKFNHEPHNLDINWFIDSYIPNHNELADQPSWKPGYAGIIQFLTIFAISETMQDRALKHV